MRLKKLISAIAAIAIASSAFAGLTANAANENSIAAVKSTFGIDDAYINEVVWSEESAEETPVNLYRQDFENVALADITYSLGGNTTARLLTNTAGNATTFFNYYTSVANNDRASTVTLPDAYGANSLVEVSMLIRMMGSNTNGSRYELRDRSGNAIWSLSANSYAASPMINDEAVTLTVAKLGSAILGASDYQATGWLKFDAVIDFTESPAVVNLTVTDTTNGNAEVYSKTYTTSAANIKTLYGSIGRSNGAVAYDDIVIDELPESALGTTYTVTYNVHGVETMEVVDDNASVVEIPDTQYNGYIFQGWNMNGNTDVVYTTEQIQAMTINANTVFTAVYTVDDTYIEAISSVAISGVDSMAVGEDADTAAQNMYNVVIIGVDGTTITENNISGNVADFNVKWEIDGFKTKNDTAGQYLDSYGAFSVNDAAATATTFDVRGGVAGHNYYGMMTATVTYNGNTYVASKPVTVLGDTVTTNILPTGGYPSDIDEYPSSLVGYSVAKETYGNASDPILGGWCMAGSDSGTATIAEENGNKYISVPSNTVKKSHVITHKIAAPANQAIFEQDIRFNAAGGVITLTSGYPIWSSSSGYKNPLTLSFDGSALALNSVALTSNEATTPITTGTWYHVIVSFDASSNMCYAIVEDTNGNELGRAENVAPSDEGAPTFYSIGMDNSNTGSIDFDNYSAYYPTADTNSYSLVASGDTTIQIPETGSSEITLNASLVTVDGYPMTGEAVWTVEDGAVTIAANENNTHEATVTVPSTASPGDVEVSVNIGGYTKTITLTLTSNAESVKFTKSSSSISIPLNDTNITAEYQAMVVDGDGNKVSDDITYAIYDKTNTNPYTLPTGITFANGVLTVTKDASAATFCIRATGTNTDGDTISKYVRVTVHGLSFDFGSDDDDAVADGYTVVTPTTSYNSSRGYGIASGSVSADGSGSASDATADYLTGSMTFKADVEKGNIYTVQITYAGEMRTGYISSDLSEYPVDTTDSYGNAAVYDSLTTKTYTIPVVTDTLDIIISGDAAKVAAITITKNAAKTATAKPKIMHVGDSTSANNGSWAYEFNNTNSSYADFAQYATFENRGAGGRNLCSYYTQGKYASVLRSINPGDIVMFGNNGTNGMGATFEDDVNFYLDAAEMLGAKIIMNSYTPHGAVGSYAGGYNSTTHTFNSYRQDSYDEIVRAVAAERAASDPNYLGFVEIGKNADAAFNAYVADYAANGYDSADAAAQAIISCFSDHNHYEKGSVARTLMLNGYGDVKGIVAQLVDILAAEPEVDDTFKVNSFALDNGTASASVTNNTADAVDVTVIVAVYAADGTLVSAELNTETVEAGATSSISATNSDNGTVKAFLWDMTNNNIPFAEAK